MFSYNTVFSIISIVYLHMQLPKEIIGNAHNTEHGVITALTSRLSTQFIESTTRFVESATRYVESTTHTAAASAAAAHC